MEHAALDMELAFDLGYDVKLTVPAGILGPYPVVDYDDECVTLATDTDGLVVFYDDISRVDIVR